MQQDFNEIVKQEEVDRADKNTRLVFSAQELISNMNERLIKSVLKSLSHYF
jgi:DNA polymerase III psi subunit